MTQLKTPRAAAPIIQASAPIQEPTESERRMSLLEHLGELRDRLFKAVLALVIGTIVGFLIAGNVLEFLKQPYGADRFLALGPTDSVVAYFRVALLVGGILSVPMITYQLLMFILPGLTNKERRYVLLALPGITLLFLVGILFTWAFLIPPAISFFDNFANDVFQSAWTADRYLGFVTALLFWMGVAFETPLVFFVIAVLGMINARTLIKHWRIAIVGSAIAAAAITPTIDPVNMVLVMGPLLALYLISILLVLIARRFVRVTPPAEQPA